MSSFDKNSNLSVIPVLRHCDVYAVNSVRNLLEILNRLSTEFLSETSQEPSPIMTLNYKTRHLG